MPKRQLCFFLFIFILCFTIVPCFALPLPTNNFNREQAISTFFKDKPENLIEGIWVTDNDKYEIAIVKNSFSVGKGYDYIGFVTQTTDPAWNPGEIKLQLKTTLIPKLFTGSWHEYRGKFLFFTDNHLSGTTFRITGDNMIEYSNEKKERKILYRIYPTNATDSNSQNLKKASSGTGFFITPKLIVTNYHVIKDSKTIEITYKNDQKATATIVAKDPANDLALLEVKDLGAPVNPLLVGNVQESKDGDTVYTVGFPLPGVLGTKAKLSEGIINSITGFQDDVRMYQISIPIQPGNSGSPLLDTKGQVLGVVTSTMNGLTSLITIGTVPQNVNFATKINYVNNLLSTLPGEIHLPASQQPLNDLTPGQIMNLAKDAVVEVQTK
jgi:S1-C subfamily serine protease